MGELEKRLAVASGAAETSMRASVLHGYPLLQAAAKEVLAAGVCYTDLTGIYRDHPEPLYVDTCCHVGQLGSEIMAVRIAAAMRLELDMDGFEATRLQMRPASLVIASPADVVPFQAVAIDRAGREVDIAAEGLGAKFQVEPAGSLAIVRGGAVRALRRGSATVRIQFGGREAQLSVTAAWPDDVVLDDGLPLANAPGSGLSESPPAPALRLVMEQGAAQLACVGLPSEGIRILAASARPLATRVRPGQDSFDGLSWVLPGALSGDDRSLKAAVPSQPNDGVPTFLRVYVLDATGQIVAASNTLVVTRG
jgi:hypothetical protein